MRTRAIVLAAVAALVLTSCQQRWPMARSDAGNTGYNPAEQQLGVGQLASLSELWTMDAQREGSRALVATGSSVYTAAPSGQLGSFPLDGSGCDGSGSCDPSWVTADAMPSTFGSVTTDHSQHDGIALVGSTVYALVEDVPDASWKVAGYPLDGCGAPTCSAVWETAPVTGYPIQDRVPVRLLADEGRLVLDVGGALSVYDLGGTGCTPGSPTVCDPVWTAATGYEIAVGGGVVASVDDYRLEAYDLDGVEGCAGSPTVCEPVWVSRTRTPEQLTEPPIYSGDNDGRPTISAGMVFVDGRTRTFGFDLDGVDGCAGTPTICDAVWQTNETAWVAGLGGVPVSATPDRIYASRRYFDASFVFAYPRSGAGCSVDAGVTTCTDDLRFRGASGYGTVANGVYFDLVGPVAFDAAGSTGCTTGTATVCDPVWSGNPGDPANKSVIVVAGHVIAFPTSRTSVDDRVMVWALLAAP